jgi:hypothetical protein
MIGSFFIRPVNNLKCDRVNVDDRNWMPLNLCSEI